MIDEKENAPAGADNKLILEIAKRIRENEIIFVFDEETQRKIEEFGLLLNSTTSADCKTLFTIVN